MLENSELYDAIEIERRRKVPKIGKQEVSKRIGKASTNSHLWKIVKSGVVQVGLVLKICNVLDLELIIRNPRKNAVHKISTGTIDLYKCINLERLDFNFSNHEVASLIFAPTSRGKFWTNLRRHSLRHNQLVVVCNALGLELIVRNPKKKISYLLNTPKTSK